MTTSTKRIQRNLTIMFTDISGFTKHTEKISRDQLMNRLDTHNKLLMPIVAHFEGKVIKTIGDSFLITFESPTNAVQCGTYMQHTLRKYNHGLQEGEQIHIKVSINSGEVTVTDMDVFGDAVNVAAKIEKATNPDEIYFTENVFLAMNKAEVPNAFVKMFRPRGETSTEIKLYKVVQDPADEVYKRIVEQTKIDPDKMKTRVIELSNTAEKEYMRHQDALDALIQVQGKSSRTVVVAVAVGALVLGLVLLLGYAFLRDTGPTPEQVVMRDARDYLKQGKPKEARALVEKFAGEHGKNADLTAMLAEISEREYRDAEELAKGLINQGKPDKAKEVLAAQTVNETQKKSRDEILSVCDHFIAARKALGQGDAEKALLEIDAAFGTSNPSAEIEKMREQANAVVRARKLLSDADGRQNGSAVLLLLTKAFGDAMPGSVQDDLVRAVEYELTALARKEGKAAGLARLEEYRTRFGLSASADYLSRETRLSALWYYSTSVQLRREWSDSSFGKARSEIWDLQREYGKDAEFMWRLGDMIYDMQNELFLIPSGLYEWGNAYVLKPELINAHPEFFDRMMDFMHYSQSAGVSDDMIEKGIKEPVYDARFYIKKFFFKRARPALIEGLSALRKKNFKTDKDQPDHTMRANCFAVLADMGEAGVVKNRFEFFRDTLANETLTERTLELQHARALFAEDMTAEEYRQFRQLIDELRQDTVDGRYSSYTGSGEIVDNWLAALKEVQPKHTEGFQK